MLLTVLLRINAGGVHLIFHIFRGAFIQGRRLYEGGVYYKIQKKLQFYISTSIRKTALSSSSMSGICDQIERLFEGGVYKIICEKRGGRLFEGGVFSR